MPQIHISVRDKIARAARRTPCIVCGNADYEVVFDLDSEWAVHDQKIARFIWGGAYYDVPFMGNICPVPTVIHASEVEVGVYAGDLRTTTPATIACRRSIRGEQSLPLHDEALAEYEHRAVEAAAVAQSAASEAAKTVGNLQDAVNEAKAAAAQASETGAQIMDATAQANAAADKAQKAVSSLQNAVEATVQAKTEAQQAKTLANQAARLAQQSAESINTDTESARAHAAQMVEHAAATRTRYAFTVGQPDELEFMTPESCGIYNDVEKLRYNDKTLFTIYRYPLTDSARITSALWHAHLAQQTLLQVSSDGKTWITLLDNSYQQIGTQYHYELCDVLDLSDADALYVKITDSAPNDGYGGAILADIPVTLDVTHGALAPFALPPVNKEDEGSYLRVIGGRWGVADATALTSRVRTYSFKVSELTEKKYLHADSTGILNESCRFNDRTAFTLYHYHVANAALVRRITWTATVGQQLLIECSTDRENWRTLINVGASTLDFERKTFDLTDKVDLLAFDDVYIRISDSDPTDGFGGALRAHTAVSLHVERCEPPIGM